MLVNICRVLNKFVPKDRIQGHHKDLSFHTGTHFNCFVTEATFWILGLISFLLEKDTLRNCNIFPLKQIFIWQKSMHFNLGGYIVLLSCVQTHDLGWCGGI